MVNMFHNYRELFNGYAEYFNNNLFVADQRQPQKLNAPQTVLHRATRSINHTKDLASWASALAEQDRLAETNIPSSATTSTATTTTKQTDSIVQTQGGQSCVQRVASSVVDEKSTTTIGTFNELTNADWLCIVAIFLTLLFMKRCLSRWMKSSSLVKSFGLRKKDQERLDESLWRLLYYTFSSTWLLYSCFLKHQAHKFFDKNAKFTEYSFGVDLDEYLICMIETSFYLHATYAIVLEDVWRRDSPMMLLHHGAAIFSVLGIYATRTHRIGLAVVILRDTCDVLLEITKIVLCLRIQHGKVIKCMDRSVKCMLVVFTVAFVINQLYYYPLFCLYHAFNLVKLNRLKTPAVTGILTCCMIFLVLDLLWFGLILRLLYRMLFTNEPPLDLREYEDDNDSASDEDSSSNKMIGRNGKEKTTKID